MTHGDVEFELEADPDSKSACWLKSEISPNFLARSPVITLGSVMCPVFGVGCHGEAALEGSGTVSGADLGPEDEGVAAVEGDSWLDED
jgi:hypothetical protein